MPNLTPVITPVDGGESEYETAAHEHKKVKVTVKENDAVAGTVLATLSLPEEIEGVTYEFADTDTLGAYYSILAIKDNKIIIREDLDTVELSSDHKTFLSKNEYPDGKKRLKEAFEGNEGLFVKVVAKKGNETSKIAANYEENVWLPSIKIGEYTKPAGLAKNPFKVTEMYYYLGDKEAKDVADDEWIAVDKDQLDTLNAEDGTAGKIVDINVTSELSAKEIASKKTHFKFVTDVDGVKVYGEEAPNLIFDATHRNRGGNAEFSAISLINGDKDTFWRTFNFAYVTNYKEFGTQANRDTLILAKAEDGVLPKGLKFVGEPITGDSKTELVDIFKNDNKNDEVSKFVFDPYKLSLIDRQSEAEVEIPEGKTIKVMFKVPEGIDNNSLKVYKVEDGKVVEVSGEIKKEGLLDHFVAEVSSLGSFVMVADKAPEAEAGTDETGTDETGAGTDETGAGTDETGTETREIGTQTDETGTGTDETGTETREIGTQTDDKDTKTLAKTGVQAKIFPFAALMTLAGSVILFFKKKRK